MGLQSQTRLSNFHFQDPEREINQWKLSCLIALALLWSHIWVVWFERLLSTVQFGTLNAYSWNSHVLNSSRLPGAGKPIGLGAEGGREASGSRGPAPPCCWKSGFPKLQLWLLLHPLSCPSGPLIRASVETNGISVTTMHETWGDCWLLNASGPGFPRNAWCQDPHLRL